MNSVQLYYLLLDEANVSAEGLPGSKRQSQWLSELSMEKQKAINKKRFTLDRNMSLIALQLLKYCVNETDFEGFCLKDVCYPELAKPYWPVKNKQFLDFNISHSGRLIMVAVSRQLRLGIDVEKHRQLKSLNFKMVLSSDELDNIKKQPEVFFDLWSKKEAVVKAANTTGIARMRDVKVDGDRAILDEKIWYIHSLSDSSVDKGGEQYSMYLATSERAEKIVIKQHFLNDL